MFHVWKEEEQDMERLVNNFSVDSFASNNNELTITRSTEDGRRYSTMHFKHADRNRVDIVITSGTHEDDKMVEHITSGHSGRVNSARARFLVWTVFFLLFVMLGIWVVCFIYGNPFISVNENGGEVSKVPGVNLDFVLGAANDTNSVAGTTNTTTATDGTKLDNTSLNQTYHY